MEIGAECEGRIIVRDSELPATTISHQFFGSCTDCQFDSALTSS